MKLPTFKRRLKYLRKYYAVQVAIEKAIGVAEEFNIATADEDLDEAGYEEALYDLAFEEGFRAAVTVMVTPVRDNETLPRLPRKDETQMEFAKNVGDHLLINYWSRVLQ